MHDETTATEPQPPPEGERPLEAPAAEAEVKAPATATEETAPAAEAAADEAPAAPAATAVAEPPPPPPSNKHWYVVKVQSGREESIKDAIERRVKIEGLEEFFGQIIIPVEKVTELNKANKRVVKERKLFPGYLMVEVEYNDRILYLFRETSGVGDFVGGSVTRKPTPMSEREIATMLHRKGDPSTKDVVHAKPRIESGDRVKIKEGTFVGMEGEVKEVVEAKEKGAWMVKVEVTIWGRPVSVELEDWQVETE